MVSAQILCTCKVVILRLARVMLWLARTSSLVAVCSSMPTLALALALALALGPTYCPLPCLPKNSMSYARLYVGPPGQGVQKDVPTRMTLQPYSHPPT